jgi:hypothetical protein
MLTAPTPFMSITLVVDLAGRMTTGTTVSSAVASGVVRMILVECWLLGGMAEFMASL